MYRYMYDRLSYLGTKYLNLMAVTLVPVLMVTLEYIVYI